MLAVISGKILIMNEQKTNQLFVYKAKPGGDGRKFERCAWIVLKDIKFFTKVCMDFHF
jgi:hypothetical protein